MSRGLFIALEGIDGSGKSTLYASLATTLSLKTRRSITMGVEPKNEGQGVWATRIRKTLQGRLTAPEAMIEFQRFYVFDRAEDIFSDIHPNLEKGNIVLYDRYALSTIAYGMSAELSLEELINLHNDVIGAKNMIWPDINIILDIDPSAALSRKSKQYEKLELFEKESSLSKIREAYLLIGHDPRFSERCFIVDANRSAEKVQQEVTSIILEKLATFE